MELLVIVYKACENEVNKLAPDLTVCLDNVDEPMVVGGPTNVIRGFIFAELSTLTHLE